MFLRCALFAFFILSSGLPARAYTLWVSATGTFSGNCTSPASPCGSIDYALGQATANDTIVCMGPVYGGSLQITKSIDIDCSSGRAIFRDTALVLPGNVAVAIVINIASNDIFKTVRLRGLSLLGNESNVKFFDVGIYIQSAALVQIQDAIISDVNKQGILDVRTNGQTQLYVSNATVRNSGGSGIVEAATNTGIAVLENVQFQANAYGVAVATGNYVTINRSVLAGSATAAVEADSGAHIIVNGSTITNNNIGIQGGSTVHISNNDIAFNNTAISGTIGTFGNNRFSGNVSIGTPPTPLGGASTDFAQQ